jgi:hypothetical protein
MMAEVLPPEEANPSGWLTRMRGASAILPAEYSRAVMALQTCERIDACQDWADKAAALASYAKQAHDDTLHALATRIRARAVRRCGELLKTFQSNGGRPKSKTTMGAHGSFPSTQQQAAREAGLSPHQEETAVRVANVPAADFEVIVESDHPPTITALAGAGLRTTKVARLARAANKRPIEPPSRAPVSTNWRVGFARVKRRYPELAAAMQASPNQQGVQALCSGAGLIQGHFPAVWQFRERLSPERFIALAAATCVRAGQKWSELLAGLPAPLFDRAVTLAIDGTLETAFTHRRPIPSKFYPGIDPSLDAWLLKAQRETDHDLLEPLSRVDGWAKQREFVERYLSKGREHAETTIKIPDYEWLLTAGTDDDRQAWQFLRVCHTYFKLGPDAMTILCGALHRMTDKEKWLSVLDSYTAALSRGETIDVAVPPWEKVRK